MKKNFNSIKVFISVPMNERSIEDIETDIYRLIVFACTLSDKVEIINSYIENPLPKVSPLWYLARSLQLMSCADIVLFDSKWKTARGCRIEHKCCEDYNIKYIEF